MTENAPLLPTKRTLKKNLYIICISFSLLYTSLLAVSNLQSSVNARGDVGYLSLAILYGTSMLAATFLPHPCITVFGYKWTLFLAEICMIPYIAANMYPVPWLMYPTAALAGLFKSSLWTARSAYMTKISFDYTLFTDESCETLINRNFGIFNLFYQMSQIFGNLVSYLVLYNSSISRSTNSTLYDLASVCGANFCEQSGVIDSVRNSIAPNVLYLLYGIFVGIAIAGAILVALVIDQHRKTTVPIKFHDVMQEVTHHLLSTVKQWKQKNQLLLIPLTIYFGFNQAFLTAQFTQSFITCPFGVASVGLVLIVFGVCDSIASYVVGYMEKYLGCFTCLIIATLLNTIAMLIMIFWVPTSNQIGVVFAIAILWSIGDAIWQTPGWALYSTLFPENKEAAFANLALWEDMGYFILFMYAPKVLVRTSLIFLLVYLLISMVCYVILEANVRKKRNEATITIQSSDEEQPIY